MNIHELLTVDPIVPLVQADDPEVAVNISRALAAGGLRVVEVVLRTERALDCLQAVAGELPDIIAGAGTVLTAAQANAAVDNGANSLSLRDSMTASSAPPGTVASRCTQARLHRARCSMPSISVSRQ